jgi:glycosyltransferase involved in cell wall biosynthesis
MKIAFINGLYPPQSVGGAEIVLQTLVEGVRDQGHEVLVLTTKDGGDLARESVNGVPVIRVPIRNMYWHGRRDRPGTVKRAIWHALDSSNSGMQSDARKILQEERPDALNVHVTTGWSAGVLAVGRSLGIPTVQVLHDWNFLCPNSNMYRKGHICKNRCLDCNILRARHKAISNNADAVVGVSQFILDGHLANGYFSTAKQRVAIHNARDLPATDLASRPARTKDRTSPLVFGVMGTVHPAKGVEFLIQEFLSLGTDAAQLWIAGKGKPEYEAYLKDRYASPQVRFLGFTKQADFFPYIDVLVFPSLSHEALGMVVPEAFAFGVPVIGSKRGGIPEMIQDGKSGRLFEPENPGELRAIMGSFLNGQLDAQAMGRAAKASAAQYLDVKSWVEKYIRLNANAIAMRGS